MINNIKKSVCKANEDFIFGTDFADETAGYGLGDNRRTNGICDFLYIKIRNAERKIWQVKILLRL